MSIVIDSVTLESFKSYGDETTIDLGNGVTAILGDNGSGKSTIQEGVGYALFDTHPFRNQDRLVRDGENSGHVEVTFTNRETGEKYTVRRWAGRSKYDVLDENGDNLGLDTNSEVKDWICNQLGIDDPGDLSEAWERSVGVPQTDFLSDFTKTEKERIDTFDPLFDIERYREAYKSLSGLEDEFEDDIDELEKEITRLEAKLEELPEVKDEVEEHEEAVEELDEELQRMHEDGIAEPTLPQVVEYLHELHPSFAIELFVRGDDEVRSRVLDTDGELQRTELTDGNVYHSPTVFQLKAMLFHAGILTARGAEPSNLDPNVDVWKLRESVV